MFFQIEKSAIFNQLHTISIFQEEFGINHFVLSEKKSKQ